MDVLTQVETRIRQVIQITDSSTPELLKAQVDGLLAAELISLSSDEYGQLMQRLNADQFGLGPLEPILSDSDVTEVMINGTAPILVDKHGQLTETDYHFRDEAHLMEILRRIFSQVGSELSMTTPLADVLLPDGTRINVVLRPIAVDGPAVTIRKMPKPSLTLTDLVQFEFMSEAVVAFLQACIGARANMVVSGGTSSGKTTMFNILLALLPPEDRIIVIERTLDLQFSHPRAVHLKAQEADRDGKGEVTPADLVLNAMKMRPDRIICGELLGDETLPLLQAMNIGIEGCMFSLHATSPRDVLSRLEGLALAANPSLPVRTIRQMLASSVELILYQERLRGGNRYMVKVTEVVGLEGDVIATQDIFQFEQTSVENGVISGHVVPTKLIPRLLDKIQNAGIDLSLDVFVPRK